jgi:glycosyltransferase involved in cell wall biosynthesis
MKPPLRIAMIGQKGIPATYGGVERHVEELSVRLVRRGHHVRVYNRPHYNTLGACDYHGVQIVTLPSIATKHLDAISHAALCTAHALADRPDVIHYHAEGPALLSWLPRLVNTGVVATIHGQDWQRTKWGGLATLALRAGEWTAMHAPDQTIVVSETLARTLSHKYGRPARFIPNGISLDAGDDVSILTDLGLESGKYVLFASRLVPEKGAHYLIEAALTPPLGLPVVLAGDSSFSEDYVASLKSSAAQADIIFPGYVYGARLAALFKHAALFVLPSDLEGLPIVLLEALGYGTPVLASNIAPNVEVLGDLGHTFKAGSVDDLRHQLAACLAELPAVREQAQRAKQIILAAYDWDTVTDQTVSVYEQCGVARG